MDILSADYAHCGGVVLRSGRKIGSLLLINGLIRTGIYPAGVGEGWGRADNGFLVVRGSPILVCPTG
ncbi:protein of unknown function [Magnetospirillum sp. XM-1]|nr:protein of unknown function [Magnetospirillum sp. XM-1]